MIPLSLLGYILFMVTCIIALMLIFGKTLYDMMIYLSRRVVNSLSFWDIIRMVVEVLLLCMALVFLIGFILSGIEMIQEFGRMTLL